MSGTISAGVLLFVILLMSLAAILAAGIYEEFFSEPQ